MPKLIVPSILVKNKKQFVDRLRKVEHFVERVQIDVMDNKFVRNKTVQLSSLKGVKIKPKAEVHLMVNDPYDYIEDCKRIKAYMVIFHVESCKGKKEMDCLIKRIKSKKMKVGIALNPRTSIAKVKPFLRKIDQVLIMTVNPGFSGQEFIQSTLEKIKQLRKLSKLDIEVDGGINLGTINKAAFAGANVFVVGSAIPDKNVKNAINGLYDYIVK